MVGARTRPCCTLSATSIGVRAEREFSGRPPARVGGPGDVREFSEIFLEVVKLRLTVGWLRYASCRPVQRSASCSVARKPLGVSATLREISDLVIRHSAA